MNHNTTIKPSFQTVMQILTPQCNFELICSGIVLYSYFIYTHCNLNHVSFLIFPFLIYFCPCAVPITLISPLAHNKGLSDRILFKMDLAIRTQP